MPHYTIEIQLSNNYIAFIDGIDADLVQFRWKPIVTNGRCYAYRKVYRDGKRVTEYLHRVIAERVLQRSLIKGEKVDHRDNNPLNNLRSNLRPATHSQNIRNSKKPSTNTSGFKGVYWNKSDCRWVAQINVNGKKISLGRFSDPQKAYEAYCKAAKEHFGEFARFD